MVVAEIESHPIASVNEILMVCLYVMSVRPDLALYLLIRILLLSFYAYKRSCSS